MFGWAGDPRLVGTLLAMLLAGCISATPPVHKIGLVAPFEGQHRPAGYAALAGLRLAIAECSPPQTAWVPLALDDSYQPGASQRALAKLRVDPATRLILGPFSPALLPGAVTEVADLATSIPFLIHPQGHFATHQDWPAALAYYITTVAQALPGAQQTATPARLLVVGLPPATLPLLTDTPGNNTANIVPLALDLPPDAPDSTPQAQADTILHAVAPSDHLLWLTPSPAGLDTLAHVYAQQPDLTIILGPDTAQLHLLAQIVPSPAVSSLVDTAENKPARAPLYWAYWANAAYTTWSQVQPDSAHASPNDPTGYTTYLFYMATCAGLQAQTAGNLDNRPLATDTPAGMSTVEISQTWELRVVPLQP
ncbi:MAG: hypothetical protein WDZ49_08620 [Litorilinea sp.]